MDQDPSIAVGSGEGVLWSKTPQIDFRKMAAEKEAAHTEAEKPKMSPLSHLTSQSAAFGLWEVLIFAPDAQEREYIYQKQRRTAYNFRCLLVSTQDPTAYVLGESRGKT